MKYTTCLLALALLVAAGLSAPASAADKSAPADPRSNAQLLAALAGPLPVERLRAARALGARGPDVLPLLRKALSHDDWRVRRGATDALAEMKAQAAAASEDLARALSDPHEWVRDGAATALGRIGPPAEAAAKALAQAAADPCVWVRASALSALPNVTKDKAILLPAAVAAVKIRESGFSAKRHAFGILTRHGKEYKEAIPALLDMLHHPPQGMWDSTSAAVEMLQGMGAGAKAVAPLGARLPSTFRGRALQAAGLLAKLGALAVGAIPALEKAVATHGDERVRNVAKESIEKIRKAAAAAQSQPAKTGGKSHD